MKELTVQTLHPEKGKKNKSIPTGKYDIIKAAILKVLQDSQPTYTEMVTALNSYLKDEFSDNIDWYTMTVKLDLEARQIIERTTTKPVRYLLK